MKIAFVAFDFGEYCVRLASGIAQGADTKLLCFLPREEADPYSHLLSDSVDLHVFDKPRLREPIKQIKMVTELVRRIRAFNPDVIHLQLGHMWFNLLALPLLRGFPLVLTVHDPLIHVGDEQTGKTPQWIFDRAYYRARERIVHAPQVKEVLIKRLGIPADTVHVTPYVFVGDVDVHAVRGVQEEPAILFFGRIWPYKGLEYLIKAEPLITAKIPQAKIVIAGMGEDFQRYRSMMVNPDKFEIHNEYVSDEKRDELFSRASIVVMPYVEASQSHVPSIAYRCGKPVVASNVGGLPEMVEDGKTGFLVPPRDVDALAAAIVRLMESKSMRKEFAENGMHKLNVECAPEVVGRMTRVVYRRAANDAGPVRDRLMEKRSSS